MDKSCIAPGAGELTTFYAYDNGAVRSLVLSNMAWLLAGRQHAGAVPHDTPVLMIDWDLESPGLHHLFGSAGERPGLLEFVEACREQLDALALSGMTADADELARRVLAAVDWRAYIEQVDADRPLYLMRAGRVDDTYGERAARLDWHALFQACPALLRQWRAQMAQAFRHVFIDARSGRSAAVSVCTSLLADKIVGLFTPARRSLDGLCGVVQRAIAYRCSHEDEQRPLLLYPLPCAPAGAPAAQRSAWRRGAAPGVPGYQLQLEALMAASYGRRHVSLESYFDHVQLQGVDGMTAIDGAPGGEPQCMAAAPTLLALLDWFAGGYVPWQSAPELHELHGVRALASTPAGRPRAEAMARFHAQFPALRPQAAPGAGRMGQLADAVERQLDQLQQLVDRQALREARPVADRLRHLVLRPAVAQALRRRGAALIKLVYRHDNDTDALLAFTQDELASLEWVLNEAAAGRPLAFS